MSQLDRLEHRRLIVRHSNPRHRRLRLPVITAEGDALRATVADACAAVEDSALGGFHHDQIRAFRHMLITIIGDRQDRGSCL
jgi:DNA-binding MarR family transcriptional regulator